MTAKFQNNIPISLDLAVLDLLCTRWGDYTSRELTLWYERTIGPYVEISHYHEHSDPDVYRFIVSSAVPARLLHLRYITGKPQWGYTDYKTLRVTEHGEKFLWSERQRLELSEQLVAERWYW